MTIIGIEDCKTCKDLLARHPDFKYIEIPRNSSHTTGEVLKAKILLGKVNLDIFPVLADDNLEQVISIEEVDTTFKKKHNILY